MAGAALTVQPAVLAHTGWQTPLGQLDMQLLARRVVLGVSCWARLGDGSRFAWLPDWSWCGGCFVTTSQYQALSHILQGLHGAVHRSQAPVKVLHVLYF